MNIRYNLVLVLICIASFMLLASCDRLFGVGMAGAHKKHTIAIEVNDTAKKLNIKTKPIGKCNVAHKKAGCFVVPHNETATVTFKLHGSGGWHFTEFKVCAGIDKPGAGRLLRHSKQVAPNPALAHMESLIWNHSRRRSGNSNCMTTMETHRTIFTPSRPAKILKILKILRIKKSATQLIPRLKTKEETRSYFN